MATLNATDLPAGFRYAARAAGIKKSGKPDLAIIVADQPAVCAGTFTTNRVVAAPVVLTRERIRTGLCQAILVNSGNANACTGEQGLADARRCAALAAGALGIDEQLVAVCSTGVIGVPLPMGRFEEHIPVLVAELAGEGLDAVAAAIMTTDAFPKVAVRRVANGGRECRIVGLAKGAGMIHPNMATMLAFVLTDATLDGPLADTAAAPGGGAHLQPDYRRPRYLDQRYRPAAGQRRGRGSAAGCGQPGRGGLCRRP